MEALIVAHLTGGRAGTAEGGLVEEGNPFVGPHDWLQGGGKKIIVSTVQKFPYILEEIGSEHRGRSFAIIINEAHSSLTQGGKATAAISTALSKAGEEEDDETIEDVINRIMAAKEKAPR